MKIGFKRLIQKFILLLNSCYWGDKYRPRANNDLLWSFIQTAIKKNKSSTNGVK